MVAGRAFAPWQPVSLGAGEGIRTPDPLITNQMLYQLSYASKKHFPIAETIIDVNTTAPYVQGLTPIVTQA
jgi:hypothetical protein